MSIPIAFFPYLTVTSTTKIGRIEFWSYPEELGNHLESWTSEACEQIRKTFTDAQGSELPRMVCASIEGYEDSESAWLATRELMHAVEIICYFAQTGGLAPTEFFNFHLFGLQENQDTGAADIFSFTRKKGAPLTGSGTRIPLLPRTEQQLLRVDTESSEMNALAVAIVTWKEWEEIKKTLSRKERRESNASFEDIRLLRAIRWFNRSGFMFSDHNKEEMIVNSATALEILLDLSRRGKKESLKKTIQLLLGADSGLANWADDFYTVRSGIVHGEDIENLIHRDFLDHLSYSRSIFRACLERLLLLRGRVSIHPAFLKSSGLFDIKTSLKSNKELFDEVAKLDIKEVFEIPDKGNELGQLLMRIRGGMDPSADAEYCDVFNGKLDQFIDEFMRRFNADSIGTDGQELLAQASTFHSLEELCELEHKLGQFGIQKITVGDVALVFLIAAKRIVQGLKANLEHEAYFEGIE